MQQRDTPALAAARQFWEASVFTVRCAADAPEQAMACAKGSPADDARGLAALMRLVAPPGTGSRTANAICSSLKYELALPGDKNR